MNLTRDQQRVLLQTLNRYIPAAAPVLEDKDLGLLEDLQKQLKEILDNESN